MITIGVAFVTSVATTALLYYILHRADPANAQSATDAIVAKAQSDLASVEKSVQSLAGTDLAKVKATLDGLQAKLVAIV